MKKATWLKKSPTSNLWNKFFKKKIDESKWNIDIPILVSQWNKYNSSERNNKHIFNQ
jgi:hypothetical protein